MSWSSIVKSHYFENVHFSNDWYEYQGSIQHMWKLESSPGFPLQKGFLKLLLSWVALTQVQTKLGHVWTHMYVSCWRGSVVLFHFCCCQSFNFKNFVDSSYLVYGSCLGINLNFISLGVTWMFGVGVEKSLSWGVYRCIGGKKNTRILCSNQDNRYIIMVTHVHTSLQSRHWTRRPV